MVVKLSIANVAKAIAVLQAKKVIVSKDVKKAMTTIGLHMQNEVKLSISGHEAEPRSVDTGRLMSSVDFKADDKKVIIFSDVPYAGAVENSTRITGGPRRHFQNSLNRSKAKVDKIIKEQIR